MAETTDALRDGARVIKLVSSSVVMKVFERGLISAVDSADLKEL